MAEKGIGVRLREIDERFEGLDFDTDQIELDRECKMLHIACYVICMREKERDSLLCLLLIAQRAFSFPSFLRGNHLSIVVYFQIME